VPKQQLYTHEGSRESPQSVPSNDSTPCILIPHFFHPVWVLTLALPPILILFCSLTGFPGPNQLLDGGRAPVSAAVPRRGPRDRSWTPHGRTPRTQSSVLRTTASPCGQAPRRARWRGVGLASEADLTLGACRIATQSKLWTPQKKRGLCPQK